MLLIRVTNKSSQSDEAIGNEQGTSLHQDPAAAEIKHKMHRSQNANAGIRPASTSKSAFAAGRTRDW